MKKIQSLLISIFLCAILFCQTGVCLTSAAVESNSQNTEKIISVVALVRLKKHLAGMKSYLIDLDYNEDGKLDSMDVTALRKLLLGLPIDDKNVVKLPKFDHDGYYNQVIKP